MWLIEWLSCCAFKLNTGQKLVSIENPLSFCPLPSAFCLTFTQSSRVLAYYLRITQNYFADRVSQLDNTMSLSERGGV
jgi:hypothetical protein